MFDQVYTIPVSGSTNKELFASDNPQMLEIFQSNIEQTSDPIFRNLMNNIFSGLKQYEGQGDVLTDDMAPVELKGMKELDGIISKNLEYYKKVFKEEGVSGILS